MRNHFQPRPGRFGVQLVHLSSGQIGGSNYQGGASPTTANATTRFYLGGVPYNSVFSRFVAVVGVTIPVDADGTLLAYAAKYDSVGNAQVVLTGSINLGSLTLRESSYVDALGTLTSAERTFVPGDTCEVNVVSNSAAIDTQPAGVVFVCEFLVQQ